MNLPLAFKLAYRTLRRDRLFTAVNVIGLSLGIMSCAFIFIYSHHNLTYDSYHQDLKNIYRINTTWVGDESKSMAITAPPVASELVNEHSFVKASTTISVQNEAVTIDHNDNEFVMNNLKKATPEIVDVFTFHFLRGNRKTALSTEGNMILNESSALKIFGTIDCLDNTVRVNNQTHVIKGVFSDWPQNVDLPVSGVISTEFPANWEMFGFKTYVKIQNNSLPQLQHALLESSEKHYAKQQMHGETLRLEAQPLEGLHFAKSIMLDQPKGNKTYVNLALTAGCILMLIILVNISNLGIIRTVDSIKQQGLRKILGANKFQLLRANALQMTIVFVASWILGTTLFQLCSPLFKDLTNISVSPVDHLGILTVFTIGLYILVLLVGLHADSISISLNPISALKNKVSNNLPGSYIRKGLVVFQFIITGLVVSALVILLTQWQYIKNKDLGFDGSNVLVVSLQNPRLEVIPIKNELAQLLGPENISVGSWGSLPGSDVPFTTASITEANKSKDLPVNVIDYDKNFLQVFNIPLVRGVNQNADQVLVNQSMAMNISNPVEASIQLPWTQNLSIGGVVLDYHYKSLHNDIEPLVLIPQSGDVNATHLFLRASSEDFSNVEATLNEFWPASDFQMSFLDEKLISSYQKEKEAINIILYFSAISLFISILGLFGMVTYVLKKRLYEIGIRKVLGAHKKDLLHLFGNEIMALLAIATIVSFPLIIYLKTELLSLYAFTPELNNTWMLLPCLGIMTCAYLIVGLQVLRATNLNPAGLLRDE